VVFVFFKISVKYRSLRIEISLVILILLYSLYSLKLRNSINNYFYHSDLTNN
jgi:hypothetical protein